MGLLSAAIRAGAGILRAGTRAGAGALARSPRGVTTAGAGVVAADVIALPALEDLTGGAIRAPRIVSSILGTTAEETARIGGNVGGAAGAGFGVGIFEGAANVATETLGLSEPGQGIRGAPPQTWIFLGAAALLVFAVTRK